MIHQYKAGGKNIVMDICSGSVHEVDDVTYDMIEAYQDKTREEIIDGLKNRYDISVGELNEIYDEITELKEAGKLFVEDTYESMAGELKARTSGVIKALCLHIAHTCNLNCSYCFAAQGKFRGQEKSGLMSFETGKRALDFLVENSGARKNLEVDFFGGEPLMNWEVVKKIVEYGRSIEKDKNKNFRFTITTNGTLLTDEILEYVNKEMGNIVLSIDGRKEVNDFMRPRKGGQGCYDDIVPKFQKVAESRHQLRYFVRGTFTHNNLDFSEDVKHLADLGFKQISVEPVVAKPDDWYALKDEDIPKLCEEYDKLAKFYIERHRQGKGFNFFHFNIDLEGGPCVAKRLSGCGSGCEYLGVTPWGDLYPCHQFVGNEDFIMGNVYDGITREDIRDMFKKSNVYSRPECEKCFARYYCSGGCAANAYNFNGDINTTYKHGCELQKKRIECAIMIKAALAEDAKTEDIEK